MIMLLKITLVPATSPSKDMSNIHFNTISNSPLRGMVPHEFPSSCLDIFLLKWKFFIRGSNCTVKALIHTPGHWSIHTD